VRASSLACSPSRRSAKEEGRRESNLALSGEGREEEDASEGGVEAGLAEDWDGLAWRLHAR